MSNKIPVPYKPSFSLTNRRFLSACFASRPPCVTCFDHRALIIGRCVHDGSARLHQVLQHETTHICMCICIYIYICTRCSRALPSDDGSAHMHDGSAPAPLAAAPFAFPQTPDLSTATSGPATTSKEDELSEEKVHLACACRVSRALIRRARITCTSAAGRFWGLGHVSL